MITACTVIVNGDHSLVECLHESIFLKTSLISEILVANASVTPQPETNRWLGKIPIKEFGIPNINEHGIPMGHALGLHECIDKATNDYLWFLDHDIVFLMNDIDKFYLDIYEKHHLAILGTQHHCRGQCYINFPTVIACMIRKSLLPPQDFLKDQIDFPYTLFAHEIDNDTHPKLDGKWLASGPVTEHVHKFPNPRGIFDVGCNLWTWGLMNNWRWLSFCVKPTHWPMLYYYNTTNENNFGLQDDFGNNDLLFHAGMSEGRLDKLKKVLKSSRVTS